MFTIGWIDDLTIALSKNGSVPTNPRTLPALLLFISMT
jgi:hypothetical protein